MTDLQQDSELMGHLIAELAKFGGMDKTNASRLARILLPHISQALIQADLKGRLDELNKLLAYDWTPDDGEDPNDMVCQNIKLIIKELQTNNKPAGDK